MLACWSGIVAEACPVCIALPQATLADQLLDATDVVLARCDPDDPFSYKSIGTLKGSAPREALNLFVDSQTRRSLTQHPEAAVLIARSGEDSDWRRLAIANPFLLDAVRRILASESDWKTDEGLRRRWQFFVRFFGHEDWQLFELSYLELGRAPYQVIKELSGFVDSQRIRMILTRREYFEWRPLAILILAQNASDADRRRIREAFDSCQRLSITQNLSAWATALIESEGGKGVASIERAYLQSADREPQEIRAVVDALLIHTAANSPCSVQIEDLLRGIAHRFPSVVKQAKQDRRVWEETGWRKDEPKEDAGDGAG